MTAVTGRCHCIFRSSLALPVSRMAANASAAHVAAPATNDYGSPFRDYSQSADTARGRRIEALYAEAHCKQTHAFVQEQKRQHLGLQRRRMSLWEAAELLNEVIDDSDPDLDLSQIQHLLQTAEACRKLHPDEDWFHLAGFLHDLGKCLAHPLFGAQPQFAVVGDTHPVGCAFHPSIVHHASFSANPDSADARYNTRCGIYSEGCGLSALDMSWGHDEYMAQVMLKNANTLPPAALWIVRYHSFYAWHREGAYGHLEDDEDREHLHWVREFNKCDLYSKSIAPVDVQALRPYYESLARKYFPEEQLRW